MILDKAQVPSLAFLVSLGLAATSACATIPERQGPIPVEAGQRVQVTLASRVATGTLQGTVVSVSTDTLVVAREEGSERRLSRSQVDEVEVSVSRIRDPVRAARYGILASAPLLLLAVLFAPVAAGESRASAFGIVIVPVAGAAAVGAAIGSGPQDFWVHAVWSSDSTSALPDSVSLEGR